MSAWHRKLGTLALSLVAIPSLWGCSDDAPGGNGGDDLPGQLLGDPIPNPNDPCDGLERDESLECNIGLAAGVGAFPRVPDEGEVQELAQALILLLQSSAGDAGEADLSAAEEVCRRTTGGLTCEEVMYAPVPPIENQFPLEEVVAPPVPTRAQKQLGRGVDVGLSSFDCFTAPGDPGDADSDTFADRCELELARTFAPWLLFHPNESEAGRAWRPYWAALPGVIQGQEDLVVRIFYALSYFRDPGVPAPLGRATNHLGDTEFIVLDVQNTGGTRWLLVRAFLSAHFDAPVTRFMRWYGAAELTTSPQSAGPRVYVALNKHANYRRQFRGTCWVDLCDDGGDVVHLRDYIRDDRNLGRLNCKLIDEPVLADEMGRDCTDASSPTCHEERYWEDGQFCGWQVEPRDWACTPLANSYLRQMAYFKMQGFAATCTADCDSYAQVFLECTSLTDRSYLLSECEQLIRAGNTISTTCRGATTEWIDCVGGLSCAELDLLDLPLLEEGPCGELGRELTMACGSPDPGGTGGTDGGGGEPGEINEATIRFALFQFPGATAPVKRFNAWGRTVEKDTSGLITLQVAAATPDESDIVRALQAAEYDGALLGSRGFSSLAPAALVLEAPGAIADAEQLGQVRSAVDSDISEVFRDAGYELLAVMYFGQRRIFSALPFATPNDLTSTGFWLDADDVVLDEYLQVVGIDGVELGRPDVGPGLATGLLEALAATSMEVITGGWWESQLAFVTSEAMGIRVQVLVLRQGVFDSLGQGGQRILRSTAARFGAGLSQIYVRDSERAYLTLVGGPGVVGRGFTEVDIGANQAAWDAVADTTSTNLSGRIYPAELLNKVKAAASGTLTP